LLAGEGKNDILDIGFRRKHEVELQLPAVAVKHNIDARIDVLEFQPLKIPDTCPPLPRIARVVVRMDTFISSIGWIAAFDAPANRIRIGCVDRRIVSPASSSRAVYADALAMYFTSVPACPAFGSNRNGTDNCCATPGVISNKS
jgi:hypothetical protein